MTSRLRLHAALLLLLCATPGLSAELRTVQGEVVHLGCPLSGAAGARGAAHAACAMTCARNGERMAFVTDDAVYVIEGSYTADRNAKLLDFVARPVEAKGTVSDRDGTSYLNIAAMTVQKPAAGGRGGVESR